MITYRRADVAGFWIVLTALVSLAATGAAGLLRAQSPWEWSATGAVVLLPGLLWPRWYETAVRKWNALTRGYAAFARALALRICHYCVIRGVGRAGSSTDLVLPEFESSRWVRRDASNGRHDAVTSPRWYQGIYALSREDGNGWMLCLLPLMLLLVLLSDDRQDSTPPSATYTLY